LFVFEIEERGAATVRERERRRRRSGMYRNEQRGITRHETEKRGESIATINASTHQQTSKQTDRRNGARCD